MRDNYFYREGTGWRIGFQGEKATFPDYKYIRYIAMLLEKPGKAIAAMELIYAVDGIAHRAGSIYSEKVALDEGLSISGHTYKDQGVSDEKLRELECLRSEIEHEDNFFVKKELQEEYDKKLGALNKVAKKNFLADKNGLPIRPPKKQKIDNPYKKKAQHAIRKELTTAYSAFRKAKLKKLVKHLEENIKPAGDYDFCYRNVETPWDLKL